MPVLILPSLGPPPTVRFVGVEFEYGGERGWRVMGNNYRSGIRPATDFLFFLWVGGRRGCQCQNPNTTCWRIIINIILFIISVSLSVSVFLY